MGSTERRVRRDKSSFQKVLAGSRASAKSGVPGCGRPERKSSRQPRRIMRLPGNGAISLPPSGGSVLNDMRIEWWNEAERAGGSDGYSLQAAGIVHRSIKSRPRLAQLRRALGLVFLAFLCCPAACTTHGETAGNACYALLLVTLNFAKTLGTTPRDGVPSGGLPQAGLRPRTIPLIAPGARREP